MTKRSLSASRILRAAALAATLRAFSAALPPAAILGDGPWLPESIARESAAAVDRAVDWLALVDPDPFPAPDPAHPWSATDAQDAALSVIDSAMRGAAPDSPLLTRLAAHLASGRARRDGRDGAVAAALAACALDTVAEPHATPDIVASRSRDTSTRDAKSALPAAAQPTISEVAAAALTRLSAGATPASIRTHARWIAERLHLGYATNGHEESADFPLDPENALLTTLLASQLPPRELAIPASGLFPPDWRNHLANRLIAQQVWDPATGAFRWDGTDPARATRCAILTLRILLFQGDIAP